MLVLLTCTCGGSSRLAHKPLYKAGVPNYMDVPFYQGDKARQYATDIAALYPDIPESQALLERVKKSRFVIVVGMNEDILKWVDVARNDTPSMMEAEVIAQRFAE